MSNGTADTTPSSVDEPDYTPKVGDKVRWTSQSAGKSAEKVGTVVYQGRCGGLADVAQDHRPWLSMEERNNFAATMLEARSRVRADSCSFGIIVRVHEVQSIRADGTRGHRYNKKGWYYAPRPSSLRAASS